MNALTLNGVNRADLARTQESMSDESLIVKVLKAYDESWTAPADRGKEWVSCLCPFHGDSNPSASVSYRNDAFNCFACGEKGDAIGLIMRKEGLTYREAIEYAEEISPGSSAKLQPKSPGKPGRRVFGKPGTANAGDGRFPSRIRGRSAPWT